MAFKKNTAVTGFIFHVVSATDGSDITTGTPVGYYTLDGGAQTAIGDITPIHKGNGQWSVDLLAGEMNGDVVGLIFALSGAITASFTIKTVTKLVSELVDITAATVNAQCDIALADYDGPTNAEMIARTIPSADYFNPTTDAVATVTNLTNLPPMPANWLTAAGIAAGALDGKGDWNLGKTGYSLSASGIDAIWDELQSGHTVAGSFGKFLDVEVSSVSGGGGLTQQQVRDAMKLTPTSGAPASGSVDLALDNIESDTSELQSDWVNGGRLDVILDGRMAETSISTTGGAVDNVVLVDTTTLNSDMRGTDAANTIAPDNAGIAAILVDTGTTLPAAISDIPDTTLAAGDIDGFSLEEAQKLQTAALAGKLSGAATSTNVIRAADDSRTRITATVDADGNRTAVTLDGAG